MVFPLTLVPSLGPHHGGVCPVSGSLGGWVKVVGEACPFPLSLRLIGEALQGTGCGLCPGHADAPVLVFCLLVLQTLPTPS